MPHPSGDLNRLNAALAHRYIIERELGQGGMATVYLAQDVKHERKVALKVLRPELGAVLGTERFLAEIKLTARLNHPHIVPLLDSGSGDAQGLLYYVMPYVEGESLRRKLNRETQLTVEDALRYGQQVAVGLSHAHGQGVMHRDVKPENILLHADQAMVSDFGIALALDAAGGDRLTETGLSIGTPEYMSPEQASGAKELDARSDVYALGCVVHEMLTGEPPFTAQTPQAIIARQVLDPPPSIRTVRPSVSAEFESVVQQALAKMPADRWQTAEEFGVRLKTVGTTRGTVASSAGATVRASRSVLGVSRKVAIGIAGGVVIATLAVLQTSRRGTATETPIAVPSQITLTGRSELAAISPDGAYLAYIERTDSGERILVQDVAGGGSLELGLYGVVWSLHWHPNGSDLLVAGIDLGGRPRLIVLSRFGGEPRRLQRFLPFAKWSPDGKRVVMWSMDSRWLEVIDPFGRDSIRVPLPEGIGFLGGLDWSPAGQRFAIMTWHPARGQYLVRIVAADGAYAYEVVRDTVELAGPLWTPDGGGVYYFRPSGATAELMAVEIAEDGRSVREPATILSGVPALNAAGGFGERPPWLTISADGSRMLFPRDDGRANLWTGSTELNGGPPTQGSRGTAVKSYPRFSPNGDAVAYIEAARGQMDVWIDTLTVGRPRRLTFDGAYKDQLAWSPDGSRLAYGGRQGGNVILHTVDMDGVVREYPGSTIGQSLGWLDDGAVVHGSSENAQLLRYRFADGASEPLLEQRTGYEFSPRVSPDGQHLAFWRNLGRGDLDIWILGLDEVPLRRVGAGDYVPIGWESDGTHIVAMPFRLGTTVYTIHESEGSVRLVSELSLATWPDQVDYHANTGAIVAALKEERVDIWMIEDFDPRRR